MYHIKNVNPNKLCDELIKAGIVPVFVTNDKKENEYTAENTWIAFSDDTDMTLVQQIIDAHNPTPPPQPPSPEERLEAVEQALIELMMEGVR